MAKSYTFNGHTYTAEVVQFTTLLAVARIECSVLIKTPDKLPRTERFSVTGADFAAMASRDLATLILAHGELNMYAAIKAELWAWLEANHKSRIIAANADHDTTGITWQELP